MLNWYYCKRMLPETRDALSYRTTSEPTTKHVCLVIRGLLFFLLVNAVSGSRVTTTADIRVEILKPKSTLPQPTGRAPEKRYSRLVICQDNLRYLLLWLYSQMVEIFLYPEGFLRSAGGNYLVPAVMGIVNGRSPCDCTVSTSTFAIYSIFSFLWPNPRWSNG